MGCIGGGVFCGGIRGRWVPFHGELKPPPHLSAQGVKRADAEKEGELGVIRVITPAPGLAASSI